LGNNRKIPHFNRFCWAIGWQTTEKSAMFEMEQGCPKGQPFLKK